MSTDAGDRYKSAAIFAQALASGNMSTPTDTATMPQPTVSAAKSIAVIPFANMSPDPENEYFTDGMAEEIINALTKIQSLRVASRTVSFALKGKNEDLGEVGRKLKVSTVLDGSVRKMGNRLRITAQLVNVADGYQLWSERYDREMEDVFAIQDDISQAIVKSLRVILSEDEKKAIEKGRTENLQAYEFYLRGRQFFEFRRKSLEYARQMFKRAIELDPNYALAHAGIADSCSLLYMMFDARESNLKQAENASNTALQLAPDLAEAHLARGIAFSLSQNYADAEREFEKAMRLDPKLFDAPYFYGRACLAQGKFDDAVKLLKLACAIRPEDFQAVSFLAQAHKSAGQAAEGEAEDRHAVKLIEERLELNPDDARAWNLGAATLGTLGETEKALEFARKSVAIDPDDPMLLYNVACTYSVLGQTEDALNTLEHAVDKGYGHKDWVSHDPDFASIRDTPRFKAILEGM
jgi:TolB-like protein/Flp pilus assembly protein TadD